jgi:hypothetical protein
LISSNRTPSFGGVLPDIAPGLIDILSFGSNEVDEANSIPVRSSVSGDCAPTIEAHVRATEHVMATALMALLKSTLGTMIIRGKSSLFGL